MTLIKKFAGITFGGTYGMDLSKITRFFDLEKNYGNTENLLFSEWILSGRSNLNIRHFQNSYSWEPENSYLDKSIEAVMPVDTYSQVENILFDLEMDQSISEELERVDKHGEFFLINEIS